MGIKQQLLATLAGGTALLAACLVISMPTVHAAASGPVPEFNHTDEASWLNSKPITLASLKGQVVLIDFWTFECWNCYRSFPWLNAVYDENHPKGLAIVGVHTPEFDAEKVRGSIQKKIIEFGVKNPVMIDNDHAYWNALGNQYWPAFYLLDKKGQLRAVYAGETHAGDRQAKAVEAKIAELLAEPGA